MSDDDKEYEIRSFDLVEGGGRLVYAGLFIVMIVGAVFGGILVLQTYSSTFDSLIHADLVLQQQLYNNSVARKQKDTLLQQQIDALKKQLDQESATRTMNYLILYWDIVNETATRIMQQNLINQTIQETIAARVADDMLLQPQLLNLTMMVEMAELYDLEAAKQFMIKMANITFMVNLLETEIAQRIAADNILYQQGIQIDQTIGYLQMLLAQEIYNRTCRDQLVDEILSLITANGYVTNINGVYGLNGDVVIRSLTPVTTVAQTTGTVFIMNNGFLTINGTTSDPVNFDVGAIGENGIIVNNTFPYELEIYSTVVIVPPNIVYLSGSQVFAPPFAAPRGTFFAPVGCFFTYYNGNTCGWTAPDNGAYMVQVTVMLTVTAPFATTRFNFVLGLATEFSQNFAETSSTCTVPYPEQQCVYPQDYIAVVQPGPSSPLFDVYLSATAIVQGAGQFTGGCLNSGRSFCGYAVYPKIGIYDAFATITAATVTFTATRLN